MNGNLLRALRRGQGLTQHQLARRAGVSPGLISQLEVGSQDYLTEETEQRIVQALGVPDEARPAFGTTSKEPVLVVEVLSVSPEFEGDSPIKLMDGNQLAALLKLAEHQRVAVVRSRPRT